MKTTNKSNRWLLSVALAVAALIVMPANSTAQEKGSARGGAQKLMKPVTTLEDLSAIQPGDMMVMSCPKCKDMTVSYVERTFKPMATNAKLKTEHTCPSCNNTITVEGHGKAKKDVVKHVCQRCGSHDAFCCVLRKGSDSTRAIEEKQ